MDYEDNSYELHVFKVQYFSMINNCYLIIDKASRKALIIDPAWEYEKILNIIKSLNADLTTILLTHSHYDHVNLVNPLVKRFGANTFISEIEKDFYNFQCLNLEVLNHMDVIEINKTQITSILTPGHSMGSVCYFMKNELFTGDTVFIEGCGACIYNGGSAKLMYKSIQNIKKTIRSNVRIYPGHTYKEEVGKSLEYVMNNNIYFQIDQEDKFIDFRMRKHQKSLLDFK